MDLEQLQKQQLSQYQLQSVTLLQMSSAELDAYIQEAALANPLIDADRQSFPTPFSAVDDSLVKKLRWLESESARSPSDYGAGQSDGAEYSALLSTDGGLGETLASFLLSQLAYRKLGAQERAIVEYLILLLEDSGYLTESDAELCAALRIPAEQLRSALAVLRSLEPAGVGARDLSDCLLLQLDRLGEQGPARAIVRDYLAPLAQKRFSYIAKALHVREADVRAAQERILRLAPRPGDAFPSAQQTQFVLPDVIVEEQDGRLTARPVRESFRPLVVNRHYLDLLEHTDDEELRAYLTGKLQQVNLLRQAIDRRQSTILQCTEFILQRQEDFFRRGKDHLHPLKMFELADELGLHPSTISRTVRAKYIQCAFGVFPMSFFFSRNAAHDSPLSVSDAQRLIRELIRDEDKAAPLSDQQIAERAAEKGCRISRRTVAKYRDEMGIPPAFARKQQPG